MSGPTTSEAAPLLEVRNLRLSYLTSEGALPALRGVDLVVRAGEVLGVAGESGCGKSTLASTVLRLQPKDATVEGEVLVSGADVLTMSWGDLRALRWGDASIVFQGALHSLNAVRRVQDQIVEPMRVHDRSLSVEDARSRAGDLLEQVGMPRARGRAYPHQLSGGQRQRVMIAMALACRPGLVIADEPTTALDVMVQAQILDLLGGLVRDLGVGHDDHQPRPVRARRRLRPRRGDVRRAGGRGRSGRPGLQRTPAPVHPGPVRCLPADRRPGGPLRPVRSRR